MMVGLNEQGLVHDFYYPYVGLDNLTTSRSVHHKIGIWVNGDFSWLDDPSWQCEVLLEDRALIGNVTYSNSQLGLKITTNDCVDSEYNALVRNIKIENISSNTLDIRFFMHQVFEISRSGRGDTAFYEPKGNYILDYKGRCVLLIYGHSDQGNFDQYAIGNYAIEGKDGTYIDAIDGELSNNPIEHGGVDSVIRLPLKLGPNQTANVNYWIIASNSQYESEIIHKDILNQSATKRLEVTRRYWNNWLAKADDNLTRIPEEYRSETIKSLLIIKSHIDVRGGILASGDSSIFNYGRDYYCYVWPRDGAYAIWPLIRLGFKTEAKKFFEFCRDTLHRDGYLMHKYQPDRAIGSTWHPLVHNNKSELAIQEDETAILLIMLGEYYDYTGDAEFIETLFTTLIEPAANFMSRYVDYDTNLPHASYDLWEESFLTTTYTTATVIKGLRRSSEFANKFNYPDNAIKWSNTADKIEESLQLLYDLENKSYRKGLLLMSDGNLQFNNTIDSSSFYGMWMYTNIKLNDPKLIDSLSAIENSLINEKVGGSIRYQGDWYMRSNEATPPNPWFVCSLWLAQYYIRTHRESDAERILKWTIEHSLPGGVLSEQINPLNGSSVGVAPLIWSHAELVNTILDFTKTK